MCAPTYMPTASTRGRPQKAEQVPSVVAHHAETPANPLLPDRCNGSDLAMKRFAFAKQRRTARRLLAWEGDEPCC
jgi:hypothetical protein